MSSPHRYRVAGPRRIGMLSFMRGIRRRTIRRTATYLPVRARAGRDPLRDVGTSMFLATNSLRLLVLVRAVLITLLIIHPQEQSTHRYPLSQLGIDLGYFGPELCPDIGIDLRHLL